jgi:sugar/nucleoside kinase (ribokinase family)
MGLRVGIVTAWGEEIPPDPLNGIPIVNYYTENSTSFENTYTAHGRVQHVHHIAPSLDYHLVPDAWRQAPIVHLGPVAQEVEPGLIRRFPAALIGITPQGWLRSWDQDGLVHPAEWPEATYMLRQAGATIISTEDVGDDEERIEELVAASRVLVVTEAHDGARVYWHGDVRRFRAPTVPFIDGTGAGDIFAAIFFARLYSTRDPWEAARFATQLASLSVTRPGFMGIPTPEEIKEHMLEVI